MEHGGHRATHPAASGLFYYPVMRIISVSRERPSRFVTQVAVSQVESHHAFKTASCGNEILTGVIQCGKESEHCGFGWFVAELDVMFRGVVKTAFGSSEIALVEKALAKLAIGYRESFFIPDDSMMVEGLLERRDGLFPLPFTSFLQREVVVENAQRAIVIQCAEEIQGFKVVRAGFVWMVGADVKIAEIYQCVGDGLLIPFYALDREDFSIAGFSLIQITRERADVTQIAK